jgi:hypothetical protein
MNLKHEVMGLLKNFFTRKKEKNDTKQTQENYLPISNINGSLKFEITAKRLYAASQRVL